ncbi:hypothetical protein ACK8P5_26645 (plasmid) [Paenibacillus sp. EC2-1]|uniref:hypothetical protein n=1 Tax=Paenibacillus sp. EC2-1 TaxID=3388665 RepID=UPI003BEF2D2E
MKRIIRRWLCGWREITLNILMLLGLGSFVANVVGYDYRANSAWTDFLFVLVLCLTIDIVFYCFGLRLFITSRGHIVANYYRGTMRWKKKKASS